MVIRPDRPRDSDNSTSSISRPNCSATASRSARTLRRTVHVERRLTDRSPPCAAANRAPPASSRALIDPAGPGSWPTPSRSPVSRATSAGRSAGPCACSISPRLPIIQLRPGRAPAPRRAARRCPGTWRARPAAARVPSSCAPPSRPLGLQCEHVRLTDRVLRGPEVLTRLPQPVHGGRAVACRQVDQREVPPGQRLAFPVAELGEHREGRLDQLGGSGPRPRQVQGTPASRSTRRRPPVRGLGGGQRAAVVSSNPRSSTGSHTARPARRRGPRLFVRARVGELTDGVAQVARSPSSHPPGSAAPWSTSDCPGLRRAPFHAAPCHAAVDPRRCASSARAGQPAPTPLQSRAPLGLRLVALGLFAGVEADDVVELVARAAVEVDRDDLQQVHVDEQFQQVGRVERSAYSTAAATQIGKLPSAGPDNSASSSARRW